jgi:hypothetical protein
LPAPYRRTVFAIQVLLKVAKRSSFLLRIDPKVLDALRKWADDELRSVNGQVEYLLRKAVKEAARLPNNKRNDPTDSADSVDAPDTTDH